MATTTPDNIQYPVNSDQVAPLASHFKNLADSTQAALNTKADSDDPRLSDQRTPLDNSVTSAKIANGAIVDADVNASAAIAATKVQGTLPAGGAAGQVLAKSSTTDYATTWVDGTALPASQVKQLVKNETGSTIPKGSVVYISGANGTNILIALADADTEPTSSKTIGLTETAINNGASGYVVTEGLLGNLNTNSATAGQSVWLSSTAGEVVYGAPPAKPAHGVYLGVVSRANTNNGEIFVKVQNGYELEELHNVSINSGTLADKQVLAYEESSQLWKNKQATGGVTVGATAPAGPNPGDAWYNSNNGMLYVWYVDADSTAQWVQVKANSGLEASILARLGGLESQAIAYGNQNPNLVINGGFDFWQRGTAAVNGIANSTFHPDRWITITDGVGNVNSSRVDVSAQGIGTQYAWRLERTTGTNRWVAIQMIEGALSLVGKTVTVSFYVRKGAALTSGISIDLSTRASKFGTGYDYTSKTIANASLSSSTFTKVSMSLPITTATSTAGADLFELEIFANQAGATNAYFEITGVQLEIGSTATTFRRAGSTMQAELAACQRYYFRSANSGVENYALAGFGVMQSANTFVAYVQPPVPMRASPTAFEYSNMAVRRFDIGGTTLSAMGMFNVSPNGCGVYGTTAASWTSGQTGFLTKSNDVNAYVAFSAEL